MIEVVNRLVLDELAKLREQVERLEQEVAQLKSQLVTARTDGAREFQAEAVKALTPMWDAGVANMVANLPLP